MSEVNQIVLARRRRKNQSSNRSLSYIFRLVVGFVAFLSFLFATMSIGAAFIVTTITEDLPSVEAFPALFDSHDGLLSEPTRIYDRTGEILIGTLENQASKVRKYLYVDEVSPDNFPTWLIDATILAQDPGFWDHPGYSLVGIGTSAHPTLAQQLVVDFLLWDEPATIQRGLRERLLAGQATARFGRNKILEWYLNYADYGNLAYGADAAAQSYFRKSASDLNLAESAMLAATGSSPALNPIDAPQAARENMTLLLEEMFDHGIISSDELARAKKEKLNLSRELPPTDEPAPIFTSYIISQLRELFQSDRPLRGGLRIISTLDFNLQEQFTCTTAIQVSRATQRNLDPIDVNANLECEASRLLPTLLSRSGQDLPDLSAGVIAIKPETGEVLAVVSEGQPGGNPAGIPARPPGTLLTPFIYLSAFTRGFSPATLLWDIPSSLIEGAADIQNPDGEFHGPVRLRSAFANDYLIPAIKVLDQIGPDQVWRTAQQFGLRTLEVPDENAAIRLPQENGAVTLMELGQAYGVFANQGVLSGIAYSVEDAGATSSSIHPLGVLSVSDYDGKTWLDCTGQLGECNLIKRPLITPQLAYLMTHMLSDDAARWSSLGHPNPLEIGRQAGAKIGRTADGLDVYTLGFTPDLAIGVWLGSPEPGERIPEEWAAGIWHALIQYATREDPDPGWAVPIGIIKMNVCDPSGLLPTADCPEVVSEVFLEGNEPTHSDSLFREFAVNQESGLLATIFTPPELIEDKVFMVLPSEALSWAEANGIPTPPDTYDVIESPAEPNTNVQISSPMLFEHVSGRVAITGNAGGAGFKSYRLQVGQGLNPTTWIALGEEQDQPVEGGELAVWDTTGLDGLFVLQLLVVREGDRVESSTTQISVDNQPPEIVIRYPPEGEVFEFSEVQTITLEVEASDALELARVDYYIDDELIASQTNSPFVMPWELTIGEHVFNARGYDRAGNRTEVTVRFSVE